MGALRRGSQKHRSAKELGTAAPRIEWINRRYQVNENISASAADVRTVHEVFGGAQVRRVRGLRVRRET